MVAHMLRTRAHTHTLTYKQRRDQHINQMIFYRQLDQRNFMQGKHMAIFVVFVKIRFSQSAALSNGNKQ